MTINSTRVEMLIDAYGSNTDYWPEEEREAAIALLAAAPALQQRYLQAQQLDAELVVDAIDEKHNDALLARIVDNLPRQENNDKDINKQQSHFQWPISIAASILAVIIIFVVTNGTLQGPKNEQLALQEIDYWLWQEVTDQDSFESSEESPSDFMSIL